MRGEAEARIVYEQECMKRAEAGLPPLKSEKDFKIGFDSSNERIFKELEEIKKMLKEVLENV